MLGRILRSLGQPTKLAARVAETPSAQASDEHVLAQVEKWIAMIREISRGQRAKD
jgi:hypothetical protein